MFLFEFLIEFLYSHFIILYKFKFSTIYVNKSKKKLEWVLGH